MVSIVDNKFNSCVKQASSRQDFAFSGKSNNFDYVGVADAHGKVLNAKYPTSVLKKMNFTEDLQSDTYFDEIMKKTNVNESMGVGSTLCVCRIFPDKFEFSWVGDSTGKLYEKGKCIWNTEDHDIYNKEEEQRLKNNNVEIKTDGVFDIEVINKTTIMTIPSKIFLFSKNDRMNMTHALGHAGITGSHFATETIPREKSVSYKVVCATDGLWAMVCDDDDEFIGSLNETSEKIVEFAHKRWLQKWKHEYKGEIINNSTTFPLSNIDDIGVSVWSC